MSFPVLHISKFTDIKCSFFPSCFLSCMLSCFFLSPSFFLFFPCRFRKNLGIIIFLGYICISATTLILWLLVFPTTRWHYYPRFFWTQAKFHLQFHRKTKQNNREAEILQILESPCFFLAVLCYICSRRSVPKKWISSFQYLN